MAASPASRDRSLMDEDTFIENFRPFIPNKTYLCYEVKPPEGDSRIPADELKGFLETKPADTQGGPRHAELCFLDRIHSWDLDKKQHYKVTLYISWRPCSACAQQLVTFLSENGHVELRILTARIHGYYGPYKEGLKNLQEAGAQIAIMEPEDYEHCLKNFVEPKEPPLQLSENLDEYITIQSKKLEDILKIRGN